MTAQPSPSSMCLSENAILALAAGQDVSPEALLHVDDCEECQELVGLAAAHRSGSRSRAGTSATIGDGPRPGVVLTRGTQVRRYRVIRLVGSGAMGVVYEAHDPELDRRVALKLLQTSDSTGSARLYREAQALARVSHPNVVPVFDVGTFGEQVFMAMEFVDGSSLTAWLAEEARSWRAVRDTFVEAGRGLAVAHAAGLVHRDFKPDNVLVGKDGRVRVVDFGLASSSTRAPAAEAPDLTSSGDRTLTRTGALLGTPAYMAPEQYAGRPADARSDQFAFCIALFEALYGTRPFEARTLEGLAHAVSTGDVRAPKDRRGVPRRIHRALLRGLRVSPEERHASMGELLEELTRRGPSWRRWGAGVAAVALLGGIGWSWQARPAQHADPHAAAPPAVSLQVPSASASPATVGDVPASSAQPLAAPALAPVETRATQNSGSPPAKGRRGGSRPWAPSAPVPAPAATEYLPTTP